MWIMTQLKKLSKVQQERQNMLSLLEDISSQVAQEMETLKNISNCSEKDSDERMALLNSFMNELSLFGNKIEILGTQIDNMGKSIQASGAKHDFDDINQRPLLDNLSEQLTELLNNQKMSDTDSRNSNNQEINRFGEDIRNLTNGIIALQQQLTAKDEQVKQLYEELQKSRGENTEATKLFTAKHLIYIIDSLNNIDPLSDCDDKSDFINAFHSVVEIAKRELSTYFDIEPFVVEEGTIFNPREQSAVYAEKAFNPDDALHVKECQSQGYRIIDSNIIVKKASVIVWN